MSDQFDNKVDGEIWIASGLTRVTTSGPKDGSQKPLGTDVKEEYTIAYANGRVDDVLYDSEGEARLELMAIRRHLQNYGIPEDLHPILMKREVITTTSSWKHLSV